MFLQSDLAVAVIFDPLFENDKSKQSISKTDIVATWTVLVPTGVLYLILYIQQDEWWGMSIGEHVGAHPRALDVLALFFYLSSGKSTEGNLLSVCGYPGDYLTNRMTYTHSGNVYADRPKSLWMEQLITEWVSSQHKYAILFCPVMAYFNVLRQNNVYFNILQKKQCSILTFCNKTM